MAELPALATAADLATRLGLDAPPTPDSAKGRQWAEALADASGHVRDVVGNAVTPLTSTVRLSLTENGVVTLPGGPVTSVADVIVDGSASPVPEVQRWLADSRTLRLPAWRGQRVTVTYEHGWRDVPSELKKWTCVIAAAILAAARRGNLGQTIDASVSVDDSRVSFKDGGESPIEIPEAVQARLRATYGAGGVQVLEHR